MANFSNFWDDLSYMGRHYLVGASSSPDLMRQYTVCNAFIPEFYLELFKVCQSVIENEPPEFNKALLAGGPCNRVHLTLKNYKSNTGLSAKIHGQKVNEGVSTHQLEHAEDSFEEDNNVLHMYRANAPNVDLAKTMKLKNQKYIMQQETFTVKGPFGKGLSLKHTGVHVAFTAGTGVLVFLDLVARLILHNTGVKPLGPDYDDDFKFIFYISHQNLNETMGMDLCYKLYELNKKLKLNNFEVVVRLSEGRDGIYGKKQERWALKVIKEQLNPHSGHLSKVYVCGPPAFNQVFDVSLESLRQELGMEADQIEIL